MTEKAPALNHQTIGELEAGAIGYAIDKAIAEAMADCARRPSLETARTITVTLKVKPKASGLDEGRPGLTSVGVQAAVKVSTPPRAGGEEFLNVASGVDAAGEPLTEATFAMTPLLRAGSN